MALGVKGVALGELGKLFLCFSFLYKQEAQSDDKQ